MYLYKFRSKKKLRILAQIFSKNKRKRFHFMEIGPISIERDT
jgi:hypothetical protein